jgi:hypothetical protein
LRIIHFWKNICLADYPNPEFKSAEMKFDLSFIRSTMPNFTHLKFQRLLSVFFLMPFAGIETSAQNVNWTDAIKATKEMADVFVAGTDETGFFAVEENHKEKVLKFIRYEFSDMKVKWSEIIEVPSGTGEQRFEDLIHTTDGFILFTGGFSKASEQFQVYATLLDHKGKKTSDSALVHYTVVSNRNQPPNFGLSLSPDKTKILMFFDPPHERKANESISFKVYGIDLDMLWEKDIKLPAHQDYVQVHNFLIDNSASIYMLSGRNPEKSGTEWKRPQGGRYVVFYFNHETNKLKEYDVSLKDKQIVSVAFGINSASEVQIAGYYSNDTRFAVAGTFLFTIGANASGVKAASFMPFSKEVLGKFLRKSQVEHDATLSDFYLDHMIMEPDGTILLIGEQYYVNESVVSQPTTGQQMVQYTYNFDDILITKLDVSGRHTWSIKVPKKQSTTNDPANCSYQFFMGKDGLLIYFNDDQDNQQKLSAYPEGEATAWMAGRKSVTTRVRVAMNGTGERIQFLKNDEKESELMPSLGSQDFIGPVIMGYEGGKFYKFCMLK